MNHVQGNGMRQARAIAWEFWANGWRGQLLGLTGVVGFASLIYGMFALEYDMSFQGTDTGTAMHFGFYWVTLFSLGAPILTAWGTPRRRYTLPTSSFVIVACTMVCSMVSMFVLYAIAAKTMNILYDAGWPIWGPGLVAALVVAWLQAILWSTSNSRGLQLVSCIASFAVLLFGVVKYSSPNGPPTVFFLGGINTPHVLLYSLASLVCVGVGTVGFENLRHGRGIDVDGIVEWVSRLFPKTARPTPFSSPVAAQFWLEWAERGYVMPVGTALIGVITLVFAFFLSPGIVVSGDPIEFINGTSAILLMPTLVVGIFLGARSENGQFGNFNGSRPLTDSQMANAVLKSVTVGVLSSALIWAAVVGAVFVMLGQVSNLPSLPNTSDLIVGAVRLVGIATLGLGAIWGVVALMTSLVLAGKKVMNVVMGTLFGVLIAGKIGPQFLLSPVAQDTFRHVFGRTCIVLPLIVIASAFVAGWWLKLISRSTLAMAVGIVGAMIVGAHLSGITSDRDVFLGVLWGSCLAPSALAAAPLAVWWNRRR